MKKTFKAIKKDAAKHMLAPAKSIAVIINKGLTVFVKQGADVDKVREKYTSHTNDYKNYSHSTSLK